jgi:hypothetical protein
MGYEENIGIGEKNEKKIADFNFFVLFMNNSHDLSDKKNSVCHAPLPPLCIKFGSRLQPSP